MALQLIENQKTVIISTGNILSLNNITKKPGQNPTEELMESLNCTLKDYKNGKGLETSRRTASHNHSSEDRFKIFVESDNGLFLSQAIDKAFNMLNVSSVDNVVIAYHIKTEGQNNHVGKLKNIWKTLERYVKDKKILQIGLSDIEESTFKLLYDWADIKPSIVQINLAVCCVVPPTLQAFCKDHDVQLLTHSDSKEILPEKSIQSVFGRGLKFNWALRFLVHIKCRGVLTTKGYLVSLSNV